MFPKEESESITDLMYRHCSHVADVVLTTPSMKAAQACRGELCSHHDAVHASV